MHCRRITIEMVSIGVHLLLALAETLDTSACSSVIRMQELLPALTQVMYTGT